MRLLHVCAYYMYALIMHMQNPCTKTSVQDHNLNTTGLQCVHFSPTDLAHRCLKLLNAGAKIRASHYRDHFALSAGTSDYLATCSYLLKCCSDPYATARDLYLSSACM